MNTATKKVVGIVGGVGPLATVSLFERIVRYTEASRDQDHIRMLIDNNTSIPDRTQSILAGKDDVSPMIIRSAQMLEACGAQILAVPCNTSHFFFDTIQNSISVRILNMILETVAEVKKRGYSKVCVLATQGTVGTNLYGNALARAGVNYVYPEAKQQKLVDSVIYEHIKGSDMRAFLIKAKLKEICSIACDAFILGCTELPIAFALYENHNVTLIDSLDVLAKHIITEAGYQVVNDGS
jgi:aspartate racemase